MTDQQTRAAELFSAAPPVNIYESAGELSLAMPIPGAHAQHVEVVVQPERIRVAAPCKYPQSRQNYLRRDWLVGDWTVEAALPRRVDPRRSRATLNLGVLVVMAPISGTSTGEHRPKVEDRDRPGA
jgi:HSP20 family molecular chaperone IbpA